MKIITLSSLKGGVGKSLISYNIGGYLASLGHKVLMIDMDIQGNMTANMTPEGVDLGWNIAQEGDEVTVNKTISKALAQNVHPDEIIIRNPLGEETSMDLIPADKGLKKVEDSIKAARPVGYHILFKNWLKRYEAALSEYDYALVDVGPYLGVATFSALYAADQIYLVSDSTSNAMNGVWDLHQEWTEYCELNGWTNNIRGVILNNIDTRQRFTRGFLDEVAEIEAPIPIFKNYVKYNTKLKESQEVIPVSLSQDRAVQKNDGVQTFINLMIEMREAGCF